jgi:hypothetical protein
VRGSNGTKDPDSKQETNSGLRNYPGLQLECRRNVKWAMAAPQQNQNTAQIQTIISSSLDYGSKEQLLNLTVVSN